MVWMTWGSALLRVNERGSCVRDNSRRLVVLEDATGKNCHVGLDSVLQIPDSGFAVQWAFCEDGQEPDSAKMARNQIL